MAESKRTALLVDAAVDAVVRHGMLIQVNIIPSPSLIRGVEDPPSSPRLTLLLLPTTTIPELKTTLRERFGIPEQEQRLTENDTPLLHGTLEERLVASTYSQSQKARGERSITVHMEQVPLDPQLESLYNLVWLQDWNERDEIMNRMMQTRHPQQCHQGHKLVELDVTGEQPYKPTSREDSYICFRCKMDFTRNTHRSIGNGRGMQRMAPSVCAKCNFCLCTSCLLKDNGSEEAVTDPYQAMMEFAINIGHRMAAMGSYYGGRGHLNGHLPVRCESEYAPKAFVDAEGRIPMKPRDKILPDGIRLVIRFSEETRTVLEAAGATEAMLEAEIREIRTQGATISNMIGLRDAWAGLHRSKPVSSLWTILSEEWSDRFPTYTTMDGLRAHPYPTTKLIAYGLEEAVYEVGVQIDDGDY